MDSFFPKDKLDLERQTCCLQVKFQLETHETYSPLNSTQPLMVDCWIEVCLRAHPEILQSLKTNKLVCNSSNYGCVYLMVTDARQLITGGLSLLYQFRPIWVRNLLGSGRCRVHVQRMFSILWKLGMLNTWWLIPLDMSGLTPLIPFITRLQPTY